MKKHTQKFLVKHGSSVKIKDFDATSTAGFKDEAETKELMEDDIKKLRKLQAKLYANNRRSVLIILQAMDAAGKDGVIKHVVNGLNPQGCKVTSFKHPSNEEYAHDFLWRHAKALPECGQIGIFNRSHYENVLICRVHPELILDEKLPGYDSVKKLDKKFWETRFKQINRFEKNLAQNGTTIIKFFLNISKAEQRKRLLARIDDAEKNWKFSFSDINERKYWDEYHKAYEEALSATSTTYAPWYIIPADHKWFSRAAIANILVEKLEALKPVYPVLSKEELSKLQEAREILLDGK